jgi:hypothetical protein
MQDFKGKTVFVTGGAGRHTRVDHPMIHSTRLDPRWFSTRKTCAKPLDLARNHGYMLSWHTQLARSTLA